jgi:hypothetical protein
LKGWLPVPPFVKSRDPKRKLAVGLVAIALAMLPLVGSRKATHRAQSIQWSHGAHRTYTTDFPRTENPISEGGNWSNGKTDGVHWSDVRTTRGLAFGTQIPPTGPPYDDSIAVVTGSWNPNQMATATVHTVNQQGFEEVELLLRMSISPHFTTGYEITFRCYRGRRAYVQINYWKGRLNEFGGLASTTGPGLWDGDVVSASIVGNTITIWINGVQVLQREDPLNRYATGNPGIGFYYQDSTGSDSDYGFASFTASDES